MEVNCQLHVLAALSLEKRPQYWFSRRLDGPQCRSGKYFCTSQESNRGSSVVARLLLVSNYGVGNDSEGSGCHLISGIFRHLPGATKRKGKRLTISEVSQCKLNVICKRKFTTPSWPTYFEDNKIHVLSGTFKNLCMRIKMCYLVGGVWVLAMNPIELFLTLMSILRLQFADRVLKELKAFSHWPLGYKYSSWSPARTKSLRIKFCIAEDHWQTGYLNYFCVTIIETFEFLNWIEFLKVDTLYMSKAGEFHWASKEDKVLVGL